MKTVLDGAGNLLKETIEILGPAATEIIVVGGWGPFLRNAARHPGTKDVDILFPGYYDRGEIERVIERFLTKGFFLSAKHNFQLFRPYVIGAHTYVFNVDLLHPVIQETNKVEFMDIMDLDITIDGTLVKTIQTICIESGDVFFSERLFADTQYQGQKFRTLSPAGVIISKLRSCHNPKRPRDIYDIYLSLHESKSAAKSVHALASRHTYIQKSMDEYKTKLRANWPFYEECLREYKAVIDEADRKALGSLEFTTSGQPDKD